jgi:hypothetical protein
MAQPAEIGRKDLAQIHKGLGGQAFFVVPLEKLRDFGTENAGGNPMGFGWLG